MQLASRIRNAFSALRDAYRRLVTSPGERESVEERIARLRNFEDDETDEARKAEDLNIRVKLQGSLKRFLEHGGPDCVVLLLSSLCLILIERVLVWQDRFKVTQEILDALREGLSRNKDRNPDSVVQKLEVLKDKPFKSRDEYLNAVKGCLADTEVAAVLRRIDTGENLYDLVNLAGGHDKANPPPRGRELPAEVQGYFHQIRGYANRARHDPGFQVTSGQARIALDAFVGLLEWYYTKCEDKPRRIIYASQPDRSKLPSPPLAWVPVALAALVVLGFAAGVIAVYRGKLPLGPMVVTAVFVLVFVAACWFAYPLFLQHAYTGTGRWRRWGGLWAAIFGMMTLQAFTFTSLFLGVPLDETRYITPELRVGRTEPPNTIELKPLDYSQFFEQTHATLVEMPGDWARSTSLSSWKKWALSGLDQSFTKDGKQKLIVYESPPVKGHHKPFHGTFVFEGQDNGPINVKLLDAMALVRRADTAAWNPAAMPRYQQVEWWIENSPGAPQPNPGQVVTKNAINGLVLDEGDVIVLIVQLETLNETKLPDTITQLAYTAHLRQD